MVSCFITACRAPAVNRQWRQLRKFRINVSKIKESVNLLAKVISINDSLKIILNLNKSGKLPQDTPVLPQVVKLGHAPDKIQV